MTAGQTRKALAALALLAAPASAFLTAPPAGAHSLRAGHAVHARPHAAPLLLPRRCATGSRTAHSVSMRGDMDLPGGDGPFGFVGGAGGASKFPLPGSDERWLSLSRVCVLLFNPRTENEGIYTLQLRVREGYINTVVLFEQQEDAERYAGLLEAQDFPAPQVEALDPREIAAFTQDAGYKTSFIPAGTLFLPPEDNVDPSDRPWRPDGSFPDPSLAQVLADADDADEVDYNLERARLESLFGGPA